MNSADPDQTALTEQTAPGQGPHCLLFHLHLFDEIPLGLVSLFEFKVDYSKVKIKELYCKTTLNHTFVQ